VIKTSFLIIILFILLICPVIQGDELPSQTKIVTYLTNFMDTYKSLVMMTKQDKSEFENTEAYQIATGIYNVTYVRENKTKNDTLIFIFTKTNGEKTKYYFDQNNDINYYISNFTDFFGGINTPPFIIAGSFFGSKYVLKPVDFIFWVPTDIINDNNPRGFAEHFYMENTIRIIGDKYDGILKNNSNLNYSLNNITSNIYQNKNYTFDQFQQNIGTLYQGIQTYQSQINETNQNRIIQEKQLHMWINTIIILIINFVFLLIIAIMHRFIKKRKISLDSFLGIEGLFFILPYGIYLTIIITTEKTIASIEIVIQILIPFIALPIVMFIDHRWKIKKKKKNQTYKPMIAKNK